jgi:hypothetical protein
MMKQFSKLVIVGSLVIPAVLQAQTSTTSAQGSSSAKVSDLQKSEEKQKDIDDEITDARMRATLGSKSRFSFKSELSYSGGSVTDPFNSIRPNYRASATLESLTSLSGNVGMNYRATDKDNIGFGTGITITDPLHGDIVKNADDTRYGKKGKTTARYSVSTPYLSWSRGYRALDTQMISSVTYGHATDDDSVNSLKMIGYVSFSQTVLANFGASKWTGGASVTVQKYGYSEAINDPSVKALETAGIVRRTDVAFGLFPFAQYSFDKTFSFRTVFGYFQFARYENYSDTYQMEPYQSVGVGVSLTRDIYLYPNVQFTPKDIRSDRTNVALSANINLF